MAALTFCIERDEDGTIWLCSTTGGDDIAKVAKFQDEQSVRTFWSVFDLAKMVAHAHGLSGI